ncbi:phosphate propanoyltransferase [Roseospira marina]|uniref:Phosphate propanoyltransferase n=1 Tax=Roseospira marina TaxID=140057 RepID=A0A5M6IFZ3_9PROT|nr:phosphate propanoyltransferase [Roseospira marina]KAA5607062.1 phosphate propanoyltransferase [Roseospira marina]MBB4312748.1 propanediol utilization protein [Roseospira marina]MBB5086479.1 propanediol utilization protein [Roseospira marina]
MQLNESLVERILCDILARTVSEGLLPQTPSAAAVAAPVDPYLVPVGVSNRHIHLSRADMDALFGPGASLTRMKAMKQPGHYAAKETVTLKGPKGELSKVRVLGPMRGSTQVEISVADGFSLGVRPPLRQSGDLDDTPGIEIVGPHGAVTIQRGVIAALRHIHMPVAVAVDLGLCSGDAVDVEVSGPRGGILSGVVVRVGDPSTLEMHVDIEEANALGLKNDDLVRILPRS